MRRNGRVIILLCIVIFSIFSGCEKGDKSTNQKMLPAELIKEDKNFNTSNIIKKSFNWLEKSYGVKKERAEEYFNKGEKILKQCGDNFYLTIGTGGAGEFIKVDSKKGFDYTAEDIYNIKKNGLSLVGGSLTFDDDKKTITEYYLITLYDENGNGKITLKDNVRNIIYEIDREINIDDLQKVINGKVEVANSSNADNAPLNFGQWKISILATKDDINKGMKLTMMLLNEDSY